MNPAKSAIGHVPLGSGASSDATSFYPLLFDAGRESDRQAQHDLREQGRAPFVHDTLREQLAELIETRNPSRRLSNAEVAELVKEHAGDLATYGVWAFYPWSGRLVHVLPREEFQELRTSRNRNKITADEQRRLSALRVGVVGLSVGQATAITLALEGVGGTLRLADFDSLSLSNMNRLRAGVHEIGLNKCVLAARAIHEINPYLKVEIFDRGIRDDTIDAFFSSAEPLDLLFEECDDLKIKFRLRLEARKRRIPVLMETSDRGMLDVERFDREPERPLFHGLVGELDPERLAGMTTYEKVPIVLQIVGAETMSARLAASLVDVETTLKTWPQLASAVALGGAINTDAARRIALDCFRRSGRFFVDPERDASDVPTGADASVPPGSEASAAEAAIVPTAGAGRALLGDGFTPDEVLERLLASACLAPSGGNCQPWQFSHRGGILRVWHDRQRSRSFLDFEHRGAYVALGALTENLRLCAASMGLGSRVRPFPDPANPQWIAEVDLHQPTAPLGAEDGELARCVALRVTNRRTETRTPLRDEQRRALQRAATDCGAELSLIEDAARLERVGTLLGRGDRLRFLSEVMRREMLSELRWSPEETARTRDGIDIATLELTATDLAGIRLLAQQRVVAAIKDVGGGAGLATSAQKATRSASAVGLLRTPRLASVPETYLRGGVALQRLWLTATSLGLAFHPMTALLYIFARYEDGGGQGLAPEELAELGELQELYRALFPRAESARDIMLFRLSVAPGPTARSLRRNVREMFRPYD